MKTVAGIFQSYQDIERLLDHLSYRGFTPDNMGVLGVLSEPPLEKILGTLRGFGTLNLSDIGSVLAIGKLATNLDSMQDIPHLATRSGDLGNLLAQLGLPDEHIHACEESVRRGDILFTIQLDEERASEAEQMMQQTNATLTLA
jgi:hypothetical protein